MGLELLTQADYVLNACGRPVPPPGYKFVDLPKIIPFHRTYAPQGSLSPDPPGGFNTVSGPAQNRVENTSNTLFIVKGIMLNTDPVQVRIKWPSGRYWNQFPSPNIDQTLNTTSFPQGTGGNLYALDEYQMWSKGDKVTIEFSGPNAGPVDIQFWGVVRYLLKDMGNGAGEIDSKTCIVGYPTQADPQGPPVCLVGYPTPIAALDGSTLRMMPDPIEVLKYRQRFECWPNGNIQAPEFRLGNQCETDTPPGYWDESYTFFSQPIIATDTLASYNNFLPVPGTEDVIIRRWRAIVTWSDGAVGNPAVAIRTPNGYSLMGGDQIPVKLGYWFPVFPTLKVLAGGGLIIDVMDQNETGSDVSVTVTLEFDAAKRRKLQ
jgi:hypothetical protein